MSRGLQLLLLNCACTLMPVAPEAMVVTATCSKDVELPCTPRWDPPVPYTVSWAKITEVGEERIEVLQEDLHNYQHKQKNSTSLRLQNITSCNSGTYRCTLVELAGQRNQSGMVTLKVTGCPKKGKEENFKNYKTEIVLLVVLVVFYLTLIIFTCKFARHQSIFPDFSKPGIEPAFLLVTSPNKHLEPVTLHKTEPV